MSDALGRMPSGRLPLSAAQSGLWFAQQLDPDNPIYNTARYVEIDGTLDPAVLVRAIERVVAEAETLRMRVVGDGDRVEQVIDPTGAAPAVVDLTADGDPDGAARAWMDAERAVPIDPAVGPLVAQAVLTLGRDRHLWYIRAHHVALDAYGYSLVEQRVAEVYSALAGGREPGPAPFRALAEVAAEDAGYADSPQRAADREFWLDELAGAGEPADLAGGPGRSARTFLRQTVTLPARVGDGLVALARTERATWGDVVPAAVAGYLWRVTGRSDVVVGLPMMNRLGSAALRVPNVAVNLTPLRLAVGPTATPRALLRSTRAALARARSHRRYRSEDLRRDLRLDTAADFLGTWVNVKPITGRLEFGEATGAMRFLSAGPVQNLTVNAYREPLTGELVIELDANPDAYSAAELDRHTAGFADLLARFADAELADEPLARHDLAELPDGWRRPAHRAGPRRLHTLFEEQARRTPDAVAVQGPDATLTYRELDAAASRLAGVLRERGIGPERLVALALPRGARTVVAVFAVLKAGGAYLPIDPKYPAERLALVVADARPALALVSSDTAGLLDGLLPCVDVDVRPAPSSDAVTPPLGEVQESHLPVRTGQEGGFPEPRPALPDAVPGAGADRAAGPVGANAAYVIYTSGSTGRPKGVVVTHDNAVELVEWARRDLGPQRLARTLFSTSLSFDVSVFELFAPLACGGRIDVVEDPLALAAADWSGSLLSGVPSVVAAMLERRAAAVRPALPEVGAVVLAGEGLPGSLVAALRAARPDVEIANIYGPTEATVYATAWWSRADAADDAPPIGHPVGDTRAYVLDHCLRPTPASAVGELYLAGAGIARGYLGRPGLSAERFPADPFADPSSSAGSRMYRTGDLVRRGPDGTLHYLGRADHQVKVRGFRVEPGEIEAVLLADPAVSAAVVVARAANLVGYVAAPASTDPARLRDRVAAALPAHMVPAVVVVLDALPLGATGKLDRAALPDPEFAGTASGPARTVTEELLVGLFADVLEAPALGRDDDFFAMGGHSLLAMRLLGRVRAAFGAELSIRELFDAPTPARLGLLLDGAPEVVSETRAVRAERPALSAAQRRLWSLSRIEGPSPTYHIPLVLHLDGEVDPDALDAALVDLVERHESLRTVLPAERGVPWQRVLDPAPFLEIVAVPAERVDAEVRAQARREFDLAVDRPLRAVLLRVAFDRHVLLLALHHASGDEWSTLPLVTDLATAYAARLRGGAPRWDPLPVQYADHAVRQQALLDGGLADRQLRFWRAALAGLPEELTLPTDRPRPPVESHVGSVVPFAVDADLHAGLTALARRAGVTSFMVLHAAVAALLTRLGAGNDIPLGTPVAGRTDPATAGMVGLFLNTVVLRTDTGGDPTFDELLARVRRTDLDAYAHAELPFEVLVDAVKPARSLSRHPLFQVMVTHQHLPAHTPQLAGTRTAQSLVDIGTAKFDLTVRTLERPGVPGMDGSIEYSSDLFDAGTVADLAERLLRLLRAVVADPSVRIGAVEILAADEWPRHDPAHELPAALLPALVSDALRAAGDGDAVSCGEVRVTAAGLDARADRLARLLAGHGAGPGELVALVLPRGVDLVTAVLAVGRTGAAYLPIDPGFPAERISLVLADAAPTLVLTTTALLTGLPVGDAPVLLLDAPGPVPAAAPAIPVTPHGDDLAYVIYTSGSTGRPKGVEITHRAMTNFVLATLGDTRLTPSDALLAVTTIGFDIAVLELFAPLLTGARLVVAPPGTSGDPSALAALIEAEGVTVMQATPTLWAALVERHPSTIARLRVLVGGEALPPALAVTLAGAGRGAVNMYGPTETTVWSSGWEIEAGTAPSIGAPLWNTTLYVLDDRLRPVPPGVAGELYIGGLGLARGYRGRPGLTAERFVADPFDPSGARFYRTGDTARYRRDGHLEVLGRSDGQVKIRGFRIELGEVEAALSRLPGVGSAAVVAREDAPGRRILVGYVTPTGAASTGAVSTGAAAGATAGAGVAASSPPGALNPAVLRAELAMTLPDYMVPSAIVVLDALPLTPNRKVDRRALPAPGVTHDATRAPATDAERTLHGIVVELLGLPADAVGADDAFFDLGGDSILAIGLAARAAEAGLALRPRDVFAHPTIAALAAVAAPVAVVETPVEVSLEAGPDADELTLLSERFGPVEAVWPVAPLQEGLLFHAELGADVHTVQWFFDLAGTLDVDRLRVALAALVRRHAALRTAFTRTASGRAVQVVRAADAPTAGEAAATQRQESHLPVPTRQEGGFPDTWGPRVDAAVTAETADAADLDAIADARRAEPFDVTSPPLLRLHAVRLPTGTRLMLTHHHIALDGWSVPRLVDDLLRLYADPAAALPAPVSPEGHLRHLARADTDADRAAWAAAFTGTESATLAVPAASDGTVTLPREYPVDLGDELPGRVLAAARRFGVTPNTVLQWAWGVLLARTLGRDDVAFAATASGRAPGIPGAADAVGLLINTVAVRVRFVPGETVAAALRRLQDEQAALIEHQHSGLADIQRAAGHTPLFDTFAVFENFPLDPARLAELAAATGVEITGLAGRDASPYPLGVVALPDPGLRLVLRHRPDVVDDEQARRVAVRLRRVLEGIAAAPDGGRADAVDVLDDAELARLDRLGTGPGWGERPRLEQLVAEWAARTPDAPAVRDGATAHTYAELDAAADRLAQVLVAAGAGRERVVALALPRSADLVVAVLAVARAGAAYLPLDPAYPAERTAFMVADARPVLTVATRETAASVRGPVLVLDDLPDTTAPLPERRGADDAAYLIYTSGTTGRPKGVVVSHAGLGALGRTLATGLHVGPGDRVLQFASPSFDTSVWEIAMALFTGAELVVVPAAERLGEPLARFLARERITHLTLPPSALAELPPSLPPDTVVVVAGEASSGDLVRRWAERVRLFNSYGPTETTVDATLWAADAPLDGPVVPIGRPVVDTVVRVLDPALRPVPDGTVGELYVGGSGLARGYHDRPGLTAARFVAGSAGSRLYRTGDLVRRRDDGDLEYAGRADEQVKVRGFRVEPAEVEAVLRAEPGVRAAAVVARRDGESTALVAYVVGALDPAALRRAVADRLPDFMVPGFVVALDALPLTPNGKLDRAALPAPTGGVAHPDEVGTPAEELLRGLFAEVLEVGPVGLDDDFFALGGHSLTVVRVLSRLRAEHGVDLSVQSLFDRRTPAALAPLLAPLLAPRPAAVADAAGTDRPELVPAGPAQRRLWFLGRLDGPSPAYTIPVALRLRGRLRPGALNAALADVAARHEALRTLLVEHDGEPYQQVLDPAAARPTLEFRGVTAEGLPTALTEAARQSFDLGTEVPWRATLLLTAADDAVLVLAVHHTAADEGSFAPLLADLDTAYRARSAGGPPVWAAPARQYVDHVLAQRSLLGDPDTPGSPAQADREHWVKTLAGLPAELDLPTDRPRPSAARHRGVDAGYTVPAPLAAAVHELAAATGTSAFMVLQAAVAVLLCRMGAGADVPLGTPVSRRDHTSTVGFFTDTAVLRTDLSGTPTFRALLARVRDAVVTAMDHLAVPFEQLVDALAPERSLARHPLFQTMVAYQRRDEAGPAMGDLDVGVVPLHTGTARFDLTFGFVDHPGGPIDAVVNADTALFDDDTATGFGQRMLRLLAAVTADPDRPVDAVDLRSDAERAALAAWNDTAVARRPATLVDRLVAAAEANPDAVAVRFDGTGLTYRELHARAARLAARLRERGAGPETTVGVAIPRSVELVVALLAVLRTGAAYLPLDSDYPAERLAWMVENSRPVAVLTIDDVVDRGSDEAPAARVDPRSPAYVIYTSGSTGRPKGVVVSHEAIVNRLDWMQAEYGLTPADRVLQKTPASFDVSVWEFFWPLVQGATLVVAPPGAHRDPAELAALIIAEGVTTTHFVPSMLDAFLADPAAAGCRSLRRVVCSGEALAPASVARFREVLGPVELHNLYGPTEAAVDVTHWPTAGWGPGEPVPIGRPVHNTTLHVLDPRLRPVPPGVAGELYLGGVQLARGYAGASGLTATRFVAAPGGARLYRTGDRARWSRSGQVEYLGRADDQVKIRGLRIEPGEITARLLEQPGVGEAAVVVRESRLVGYVVGTGAQLDTDALRTRLAAVLPDYMVPTALVVLDTLPLTPNGKLDRRALPDPEPTRPSRAPAGAVEELLCRVVAEVLGRDAVGADDDFFAIGGDSIVSIRLVGRLRAEGLGLSPRDVFTHRTPAGLAAVAEPLGRPTGEAPGAGLGEVPWTPVMTEFGAADPTRRRFSQAALLTLPARPGSWLDVLVPAVQAVLDRHDMLRARTGDGVLVVPEPGTLDAATLVSRAALRPGTGVQESHLPEPGGQESHLPVARGQEGHLPEPGDAGNHLAIGAVTAIDVDDVRAVVVAARERLDPAAGRMLDVTWLDAGPATPGRLLVLAHHLVVDAVSWQILVPDLAEAVAAVEAGRTPELAPVPTSFRTWARALPELDRTGELDLWRGVRRGGEPVLGDGPLDPARDLAGTAGELTSTLPAEETTAVLETVPEAFHAGVPDVLLTALALAVSGWHPTDRVLVELEGHGREEQVLPGADLSRTVGWFTTTYPVALDLAGIDQRAARTGGPAAGVLLKRVKEHLRLLPDHGIGHGLLAAALADEVRPQILLNWLGRTPAPSAETAWSRAPETALLGAGTDPEMPLRHALTINAYAVHGGELTVSWTWPAAVLDRDRVAGLAAGFTAALRALVRHARSDDAGGHTPSDLGLVTLQQRQIDRLEAKWKKRKR